MAYEKGNGDDAAHDQRQRQNSPIPLVETKVKDGQPQPDEKTAQRRCQDEYLDENGYGSQESIHCLSQTELCFHLAFGAEVKVEGITGQPLP